MVTHTRESTIGRMMGDGHAQAADPYGPFVADEQPLDGDIGIARLGRQLLRLVQHAHRIVVEAGRLLRPAAASAPEVGPVEAGAAPLAGPKAGGRGQVHDDVALAQERAVREDVVERRIRP